MALARSMLALDIILTAAGLALLVLPGPGVLLVIGLVASAVGYIGMATQRGRT